MPATPSRTLRNGRPGFSLLELMIAIIIFGIGMVMVATVFPVGLDMTRETIQLDLSQAATDAAMAALILRVPTLNPEMDPEPANTRTTLRAIPDVAGTDLDAEISGDETDVFPDPRLKDPNWTANTWQTEDPDIFPYLRAFTEQTGWAAELLGNNDDTAVVPTQNLPSGYQDLVDDAGGDLDAFLHDYRLTMIPPTFGVRSPLPRIHLADQVYPPVSPHVYGIAADTVAGAGYAEEVARPLPDVVEALASRRYSWHVMHCMTSPDPQNRRVRTAIAVTYRGDLAARFAAQDHPDNDDKLYNPHFDPSVPKQEASLLLPRAVPNDQVGGVNPWNKDALFPRPWLVILNRVDRSIGEVRCSNEVAALLPAGAYFVVASRSGPLAPLETFMVLRSNFNGNRTRDGSNHAWTDWSSVDVDDEDLWATLQIARGGGGPVDRVPVWVFPPAIERTDTGAQDYRFLSRSPVVSVAQREVPVR